MTHPADIPMLAQAPPSNMYYTVDQVLSPYIWVFVAAWFTAILVTPIMRALALRNGIVDWPDKTRKRHLEPIAYLGGVAVFAGWMVGVVCGYFTQPHTGVEHVQFPTSIVVGAVIITIVGLFDDVYHISPRVKIGGQLIAAAMMAGDMVGTKLAGGIVIPIARQLGVNPNLIPESLLYWLGACLVVVFVVGGCNAANLLDGLDGLVSGVTAIVATGLTFIAVSLAMGLYSNFGAYSPIMDPVRVVTSLALLGAVLGFLPYNFNPANIFLGDAGSMLVGFLSVSTILLFAEKGEANLVMAAMIVFAVPILDTTLAIIRRKLRGQPLFSPDAQHLHHQLIHAGFTVRQSVALLYIMAVFFAVLGCSMIFVRLRYVATIFLVVFGFLLVTAFKVGHRQWQTAKAEQAKRIAEGPTLFDAVQDVKTTEPADPAPATPGGKPATS